MLPENSNLGLQNGCRKMRHSDANSAVVDAFAIDTWEFRGSILPLQINEQFLSDARPFLSLAIKKARFHPKSLRKSHTTRQTKI